MSLRPHWPRLIQIDNPIQKMFNATDSLLEAPELPGDPPMMRVSRPEGIN